jgi:tetratricopeptide (TPR) repeat protein
MYDKNSNKEGNLNEDNYSIDNSNAVVIEDIDDPIEKELFDLALLSSLPKTYENTTNSSIYNSAKEKLQAGLFEEALSIIENGITTFLSLLESRDEMHESIAPLYYLYGTTLLYSIEESQDNPENSLMAAQQGGENSTEDLQIAWENLETARSILDKSSNHTLSAVEKEDRDMDLAQIYARLGDLSRHNGHYEQAIDDYQSCCNSRRDVLKGERVWNRKIADVEYSLGMTCLLLAAEGEKNLLDSMDQEEKSKCLSTGKGAGAAVAATPLSLSAQETEDAPNKVKLSPSEITALREKSARHYVQCSRVLAGLIGGLCGKNASEIAATDSNLENDDNKKISATGGTKTSGLDESVSVHDQASAALKIMRERVSTLKPENEEDCDKAHDLREMLDEIQETIDNTEQDKEGLKDLSLMRKKAEEDANNSDEVNITEIKTDPQPQADGGVTSIGFGNETSIASVRQASSTNAAPMMVVKKKKKKRDNDKSLATGDDAKRLKVETNK